MNMKKGEHIIMNIGAPVHISHNIFFICIYFLSKDLFFYYHIQYKPLALYTVYLSSTLFV